MEMKRLKARQADMSAGAIDRRVRKLSQLSRFGLSIEVCKVPRKRRDPFPCGKARREGGHEERRDATGRRVPPTSFLSLRAVDSGLSGRAEQLHLPGNRFLGRVARRPQ